MSKLNGDLVLAWQVFSRHKTRLDFDATTSLGAEWYEYEGIALENKHGVTCEWHEFEGRAVFDCFRLED